MYISNSIEHILNLSKVDYCACLWLDWQLNIISTGRGVQEPHPDGVAASLHVEVQWSRLPLHATLQIEVELPRLTGSEGNLNWKPVFLKENNIMCMSIWVNRFNFL